MENEAVAKTATKGKAVPKIDITFADWLKTKARARGEIATFVKEFKAPGVKLPKGKKREVYENALGNNPGFPLAWARYEQFTKRGSQSKVAA
jgi:hypothetical protein